MIQKKENYFSAEHKPRHYQTLDGLRGVGALLVAANHFSINGMFLKSDILSDAAGFLAVNLFFVLSGVVMAEAYAKRLSEGLTLWGFFKIRLIRFYPYYILALSLSVIMVTGLLLFKLPLGGHHWTVEELLISLGASIFMLPTPMVSGPLFLLVPQAWSLFYEFLVNMLWARMVTRLGRRALYCLLGFSACGLLMLTLYDIDGDGGGRYWGDFVWGSFRILYSFGAGLLIHDVNKARLPKVSSWIILLFVFLVLGVSLPFSWVSSNLYFLMLMLVFIPGCVLLATVNEPTHILEINFSLFMGSASYGIYLIHDRCISFFHWILNRYSITPNPLCGILMLTGVVCAAHWLDRVWDRPARRWMRKLLEN